jgi:hypothetical protein
LPLFNPPYRDAPESALVANTLIIALLIWSWGPAEMFRAGSLLTDWRNMPEFGRAFLRPDFRDWSDYLADMIVTIQIAIWGTALAAILGAPFAILASSNICPQWVVREHSGLPLCRDRRAEIHRSRCGGRDRHAQRAAAQRAGLGAQLRLAQDAKGPLCFSSASRSIAIVR